MNFSLFFPQLLIQRFWSRMNRSTAWYEFSGLFFNLIFSILTFLSQYLEAAVLGPFFRLPTLFFTFWFELHRKLYKTCYCLFSLVIKPGSHKESFSPSIDAFSFKFSCSYEKTALKGVIRLGLLNNRPRGNLQHIKE